ANDGAFFHLRVHSQVSKRTNSTIVGNIRVDDYAVIFDGHAVSDAGISDAGALMNLTSFTKNGFALDVDVGMNHAVAADLRVTADIRVRRIDEGHAILDH